METPPFQQQVVEFVVQNGLEIPVGSRLLDLSSEIGKLAKELLKASNYGRQEFFRTAAWVMELGDVFFALICLANTTEVNLLESLENALLRYQNRLHRRGDAGSGE